MHSGLPVKGYQKQSDIAVATVNQNKVLEERVLRQIETIGMAELTGELDPDKRWLALARTHIEQGFMALNRAVFKPGRVALPEDHASDCATNNAPAYPPGPCDCGAEG